MPVCFSLSSDAAFFRLYGAGVIRALQGLKIDGVCEVDIVLVAASSCCQCDRIGVFEKGYIPVDQAVDSLRSVPREILMHSQHRIAILLLVLVTTLIKEHILPVLQSATPWPQPLSCITISEWATNSVRPSSHACLVATIRLLIVPRSIGSRTMCRQVLMRAAAENILTHSLDRQRSSFSRSSRSYPHQIGSCGTYGREDTVQSHTATIAKLESDKVVEAEERILQRR